MVNPQYPMHQMPTQPPVLQRPRGTSRVVPVVVSAGLAVGVFCGLLFGLGTGESATAATETTPAGHPTKPRVVEDDPPPPPVNPSVAVKPHANPTIAVKPPVVTKPSPVKAKIIVELTPSTILPTAQISVDGAAIQGGSLELDLGEAKKKEVMLVVKAAGFKDHEQKVEVEGDTTVKIEMIKRPTASGPTVNGVKRPPAPGGKKRPQQPSTLIDI